MQTVTDGSRTDRGIDNCLTQITLVDDGEPCYNGTISMDILRYGMGKFLLICNPVAGNGASKTALTALTRALDAANAEYEVRLTEYPQHATNLARASVGSYDCIVAVGGDGTVHEVALGLIGTQQPMGIVPCGTGNDFVRPTAIPADPAQAADVLLHGQTVPIDTGLVNGEPFVNVAGFGFDVDVLDQVEFYKKRIKNGSLAYLMGLLRSITKPTLRKATITVDGGEPFEKDVLLIAAGNGTDFGAGMKVTPLADFRDGLLDVCIIHDTKFPKLLAVLPKFLKGQHIGSKYVTYTKARTVTAVCEPASRLDIDGERENSTPVTFEIRPNSLLLRVAGGNA